MLLNIKNLTLSYDKVILSKCNLEFQTGQVTVITGKSGSGKTALLSSIAFNEPNAKLDLYINNEFVDDRDYLHSNVFSYVFQDYALMDNLTIQESLSLMNGFSQEEYDLAHLLETIHLDHLSKQTKVKKLSGGEKQRLAIGMAIAKNTPFILMDEPTASLDEQNAIVISNLIQNLKENGKGIIISTHSPELFSFDQIITIENQNVIINLIDSPDLSMDCMHQKSIQSQKILKLFKKNKLFSYLVYPLILGLSIGLFSIVYLYGNGAVDYYKNQLYTMNDHDLLVFNKYQNTANYLNPSLPIDINEIKQVDNIDNSFPLIVLGDSFTTYVLENHQYHLTANNWNHITYHLQDGSTFTTDIGLGFNGPSIVSFDEKKSKNELITTSKEGLYLSKVVADQLGIQDTTGITVSFDVAIPVIYTKIGKDACSTASIKTHLDMPIKGIKEKDTPNNLTYNSFPNCFYLDYQEVQSIIEQTIKANPDFQNELRKIDPTYKNAKIGYDGKGVVVSVENLQKIDETIQKIKSIDPNHFIYGAHIYYQDYVELEENINQTKVRIAMIVLVIIVLFNALVQKVMIHNQRKDYIYMMINGINKVELQSNFIIYQLLFTLPFVFVTIFGMKLIFDSIWGGVFVKITIPFIICIIVLYILLFISSVFIRLNEFKIYHIRELTNNK